MSDDSDNLLLYCFVSSVQGVQMDMIVGSRVATGDTAHMLFQAESTCKTGIARSVRPRCHLR